jgi:ABC-type transport system involved in multi-copper enzyme maturation permease subunit
MNQARRAEFRKLLTVRSSYVLSGLVLLLIMVVSFYGSGFKNGTYDNLFYAGVASGTSGVVSFVGAIIAVLLMAHEYRYNTIVYALTLSNNRSKVLVAKITAVLTYIVIFSVFAFFLSIGLATLGASIAGHNLPHQDFNILLSLGKSVFYCAGFALAGLLITVLLRNLTASVAALFLIPNTLEGLLNVLLKDNSIYLPFTALQQVVAMPDPPGAPIMSGTSATHGAVVFIVYLIVFWALAWWLFLHRDSN